MTLALAPDELEPYILESLIPEWRRELERLDWINLWYRWRHEDVKLPRSATPELRALVKLSKTPWLGLVVTSTAQCLFVDGYRSMLDDADTDTSGKPKAPTGPWGIWQGNRMDRHQMAIHRAALAYGYTYVKVLPGQDFRGKKMPIIQGVSPRKMFALYENIAEDDWPEIAMQILSYSETSMKLIVFDSESVFTVNVTAGPVADGQSRVTVLSTEYHGAGVCPIVRYCTELDLDGNTFGEVEPYIGPAARINKTDYDRLLTQHFNSWKVRWVAGLSEPDTEELAARRKLKLAQDDRLVFEDVDTKMGSLPETTLSGFIAAHESDVEALAAVSQTPTHELTGQLINLSAEALAAARASQGQKVDGYKRGFGAGHVQALQLASYYDGDTAHAEDITGRVTWQDTSIRSMAQAVDALGKAATMLHVPDQALWGRIPGVEKSDVEEWQRMAAALDPLERMQATLDRQGAPAGTAPAGASPPKPAPDV